MAKPKNRVTTKDYKFCVLLYPDSESYSFDEVLGKVVCCPLFAYIDHSKDKGDDGEILKEHIHVVLKYNNPCLISTVANRLGIPENFIEFCSSYKSALKYLVHRTPDSIGKYPYDPKIVVTNIPDFLEIVGEVHEGSIMLDFFNELDKGISPFILARKACQDASRYAVFRRNWSVIFSYSKSVQDIKQSFINQSGLSCQVDMSLINQLLNVERKKGNENSQCQS